MERVIISSLLSIPVEFFKNYLKVAFETLYDVLRNPRVSKLGFEPFNTRLSGLKQGLKIATHEAHC